MAIEEVLSATRERKVCFESVVARLQPLAARFESRPRSGSFSTTRNSALWATNSARLANPFCASHSLVLRDLLAPKQRIPRRSFGAPPLTHPRSQKIALVTVTFLIALLVSDTVAMISLAGSLTGSLSALLLPPIIAIKLLSEPGTWSDGEGFKRRIVLGGLYFSLLVGFVMTTAGVFASAKNIVEGSSSDP